MILFCCGVHLQYPKLVETHYRYVLQIYQFLALWFRKKCVGLCCCLFMPMDHLLGIKLNIENRKEYVPPRRSSSSVRACLFVDRLSRNRNNTGQNEDIGSPVILDGTDVNYVSGSLIKIDTCNSGICIGETTGQGHMETTMRQDSCYYIAKPENCQEL